MSSVEVALEPGHYLVAVSGGVDSVVLLDVLARQPDVELVVAHFDHGIRPESHEDEALVRDLAAQYNLSYIYERAELGPHASEAQARAARYDFLRRAMQQHQCQAIVIAHHADDVVETMILNILRGTGRWGLSPFLRSPDVVRPLLQLHKAEIVDYAQAHKLHWHEDKTNENTDLLRNYIRRVLIPAMQDADPDSTSRLLTINQTMTELNPQLDASLATVREWLSIDDASTVWQRARFVRLDHVVARELMHMCLHELHVRDLNHRKVERAVWFAKTARVGAELQLDAEHNIVVDKGGIIHTS